MALSRRLLALFVCTLDTASAQHSAACCVDDAVALVATGARIRQRPGLRERPPYKPPRHHIEEHLPAEGTKMAQKWHMFEKNRAVRKERRQAKWDAEEEKRAKARQYQQPLGGETDLGEKIPINVKDPTGKKITVYAFSKTNVQPMFDKIIRRFGYSEEQARDLHFVWNNQELDPTDVPVEIGLEAGSVLSLEGEPGRQRKIETKQQEREQANAEKAEQEQQTKEEQEAEALRQLHARDMIHLKFKDPSTQKEVRLAFKRRNALQNLFKIVCKRMDLVEDKVRFVVDLTKKSIGPEETPFMLNLHEDDVIRVARAG